MSKQGVGARFMRGGVEDACEGLAVVIRKFYFLVKRALGHARLTPVAPIEEGAG
ncbi:MAG: hypothetical protein WDZ50_05660 [Woeseia sp.]